MKRYTSRQWGAGTPGRFDLALVKQVCRFGVVGVLATLVHSGMFLVSCGVLGMSPLAGNTVGFGAAVLVSFVGQAFWTFASPELLADRARLRIVFLKFCGSAALGFGLNTLFVYGVTEVAALDYVYALVFILFVTPAILFLSQKFWVFGCGS